MAYSPRTSDAADEPAALLAQAGDLLAQNNLGGARDLLERAISSQPKNQKIQSLLGMACFKLGHLERAAELYELLVRENPVEPTLRVNLGLVYLKMDNLPLAIREFQAGVDLAPEHKKGHNYLGLALAQAGEYHAARESFISAGSVAMVEKMDRAIAEEGSGRTPSGGSSRSFPEIEPHDVADRSALPSRPSTTPAGAPVAAVARPSTVDGGRVDRPATAVAATLLPLPELAQLLRIDAAPQSVFEVRPGLAAIRVAGEVLTRLDPLVSISGAVTVQPEMKRFRGRATDRAFGDGPRRFARASGHGFILVSTHGRTFLPLELGEGAVYFVEESLFAFEEALTFENGRLPGKNAPDLHLVHLRGRGKALLAMHGALRTSAVSHDAPAVVSVEHLVGWVGTLTPKLFALLPEAENTPAQLAVELSGEGFALLAVPEQTAAHGRPG